MITDYRLLIANYLGWSVKVMKYYLFKTDYRITRIENLDRIISKVCFYTVFTFKYSNFNHWILYQVKKIRLNTCYRSKKVWSISGGGLSTIGLKKYKKPKQSTEFKSILLWNSRFGENLLELLPKIWSNRSFQSKNHTGSFKAVHTDTKKEG